jgi:adenosylhomocysteine nucleosidase
MGREEPIKNTNVARDQSRVGVQAGQIVGGVTIGTAGDVTLGDADQAGLRDQLAAIRGELLAARERNELDSETFAAASEELSKAAEYSADRSAGRGKLVIALKRLKGLVDGVADLGSKVAAIIAAVHGLR